MKLILANVCRLHIITRVHTVNMQFCYVFIYYLNDHSPNWTQGNFWSILMKSGDLCDLYILKHAVPYTPVFLL